MGLTKEDLEAITAISTDSEHRLFSAIEAAEHKLTLKIESVRDELSEQIKAIARITSDNDGRLKQLEESIAA